MSLENAKRRVYEIMDKTIRARLTYAAITVVLALAVVGLQARMLSEVDSRYVRKEALNSHIEKSRIEFENHVTQAAKRDEQVSKLIDEWFRVAIANRESLRVIETDVKYLRHAIERME